MRVNVICFLPPLHIVALMHMEQNFNPPVQTHQLSHVFLKACLAVTVWMSCVLHPPCEAHCWQDEEAIGLHFSQMKSGASRDKDCSA